MKERLVSEPLQPVFSAAEDAASQPEDAPSPPRDEFQAVGEPLLPGRFVWRGEEHSIAEVIERWKEYSHPGVTMPERYLRKHWFRIRTGAGLEMKIYFERKARSKGTAKQRWWLYSVIDPD